jgi:hypothetical protein
MPRLALAALGALSLAAARLPAQETAPVATAAPPESFEVDRAAGPLAFDVRFQLADKDEARLQVRFDEVDEPGEKGEQGAKGDGEHEILGLDFQPFEGARFVLSRSTRRQSLVSSALLQVPEPKGLEFVLRFELPQEGGLSVTLPDGMPVLVATTPRAKRMRVEFAASGGVLAFAATKPERSTQLAIDGAREPAFGELARRYPFELVLPYQRDDLGTSFLEKLPKAPAVKEVRVVDRQEVEGGILERWVVAFEENVEAPLVVARPAADAKRPALLCVAGGPKGNAEGAILRTLASAFAAGRTVASFELIGTGERRLTLPHDALRVLELELVGLSSFDGATVEALQVLQWLAGRADVDATQIAIAGAGAGDDVAQRIAREPGHKWEELAKTGAELADDAVRVGDDYLRLRFDSCQLNRARTRREELPPPDRSVPLADRMGRTGDDPRATPNLFPSLFPLVFSAGDAPIEWNDGVPLRKHVTIVASDRGVRVALEEWAARHPANGDETCLAFDLVALEFRGGDHVDPRPVPFLLKLAQLRGDAAEPPRVFADGAAALPLLAMVIESRIALTSFTASHAIPSFELLLARPHAARRAEPELGVLTQGMPTGAFVPNALTRWEIEDAVLELIGRGVAVDWQDPVDALRRPLSRHDRLAMWPRVRHAKFAR